jgi:hypothetical protein
MAINYPDSKLADPLKLGEIYQDLIAFKLSHLYGIETHFYKNRDEQYTVGESVEGLEVKFDSYCTVTRRLSIEVGEKTKLSVVQFTPSGILREDNTVLYAQGNLKRAWVFEKKRLRQYYRDQEPETIDNDPPTIKKFYLYIRTADSIAMFNLTVSPYICVYSITPVPLFKEKHCTSEGARIYEALKSLTNESNS